MTNKILQRREGPIAHIIFNQPEKRNAVSLEMWTAVNEAINILATDQTCGMFGMESRPVFLGQNYVQYVYMFSGKTKFTQRTGWHLGTYKYLLREVFGDMLPKHVRERTTKVGWSSPWNNNFDPLVEQWAKEDLDYLTVL